MSGTSSNGACVPADAPSDCSTQVAVSKQTALVQKLSALKSSDPATFKSVAGRVAEHFMQRAAYLGGSDGEALQKLGVEFASAAETGDLSAFQSLASTPATPPAPPPPPPVDALASALSLVDSVTGSSSASGAESFAKLSALKTSSPGEFKQVMNRVSEGLSQLAHYAQGADKDSLSSMAVDFASAAESGDISAFQPAGGAPAPTPSAPPPAPAFDALGAAFGLVDSLTGSTSASSAESFAKLSALKQSSPVEFKQLMNNVSEGLSRLAHYASGDEKDSLSQLAADFASAAESGDISAFGSAAVVPAPPPPPAPPPVDGLSAAFELVDSISGSSSASSAESFAKLSALKQSSPVEFKQLMNNVSEGLSRLAHYAEGGDKDTLSEFSVRFASAAETGYISVFAPAISPALSTPPPPPPAPPPFDALGAAFELVDSVTGSTSANNSASLEALGELKQSSPAQFKQVMNRVAEGLAQRAHYAEGADRDALSQMSTRFASAAESGDLSSFAPASEPAAPEPEPESEPEQPSTPICEQWRSGQALSAYRSCAESVSAVDRTYASALALVNSLTSAQAA